MGRVDGAMTDIFLKRTISGMAPLDLDDMPKSWRVGDTLLCTVRKPRNIKLHRKAFALLKLVWPHTEYPNMEILRKSMTIGAGFVDPLVNPLTGEVSLVPKSWEFASMDEEEFNELYSRLIDVALKLVPGSGRDDWKQAEYEIARF